MSFLHTLFRSVSGFNSQSHFSCKLISFWSYNIIYPPHLDYLSLVKIPLALFILTISIIYSVNIFATELIKEPILACIIPAKVALNKNLRERLANCLGWEEDPNFNQKFCAGRYKEIQIAPMANCDEIRITAKEASLNNQGRSKLSGGVKVAQKDRRVSAQTAYVYRDAKTNKISKIELIGDVEFLEPNKMMLAEKAFINLDNNYGRVENAIYRLNFNPLKIDLPSFGRASLIEKLSNKNYFFKDVSYTTCPPTNNSWEIKADTLYINQAENKGVARGARVIIADIPVLYVPYLSFPVAKKRKSGFLTPVLGFSNIGGFDYAQPYYLNLAPNYDATFVPHLYSRRGVMVGGQFRYLTPSIGGLFNGHFLPDDQAFKRFLNANEQSFQTLNKYSNNRWAIQFIEQREIVPNLVLATEAQKLSDDYYLQDFSPNFAVLTERQLLRQIKLTYNTDHWFWQGMLQNYQTLNPINITPINGAYQRLPQILAQANYLDLPFNSAFFMTAQFDRFKLGHNMTNFEGPRLHINPILSITERKPWGFINPSIQLVENYYDVTHTGFHFNEHFNRVIPRYFADGGLFLERELSFLQHPFIQTLEPRLFYLYVPYHNQSQIPNYDSGYMIFNTEQLFRVNRFSGMDRIGDTNQLSYAITSRLISETTGQERANLTIGQIRYFSKRRVMLCHSFSGICHDNPLFLGYLPPKATYSPVAAHGEYMMNLAWSITSDFVWYNGPNNINVEFLYQPEVNKIIRFGYTYLVNGDIAAGPNYNQPIQPNPPFSLQPFFEQYFLRNIQKLTFFDKDPLNQVTFAYAWPFVNNISTLGAVNYNVSKVYPMLTFFGVQYDNCCWAIRFLVNRAFQGLSNTAKPQYQNNFYFQILLKGLGSAAYGDQATIITTSMPTYKDPFHR